MLEASNRNLPLVGMNLLFGAADAADYLAISGIIPVAGLRWQLAISLVVLLISLIGVRGLGSSAKAQTAAAGQSPRSGC